MYNKKNQHSFNTEMSANSIVQDLDSDRDAYESEISDFSMLSYRLKEENSFLRNSLERLANELERHIDLSASENKALLCEISRLCRVYEDNRVFVQCQEKELFTSRQCAAEFSEQLKLQKRKSDDHLDELEKSKLNYTNAVPHFKEAQDSLDEARSSTENERKKALEASNKLISQLKELNCDKTRLNEEISALQPFGGQQKDEITIFRSKRAEALKARQMDEMLKNKYCIDEAASNTLLPVEISILEAEPIFCVTLDELNELRGANTDMMAKLEKMSYFIQDVFTAIKHKQNVGKESTLQLQDLTQEVLNSRIEPESIQLLFNAKQTDSEQSPTLFPYEIVNRKREVNESRTQVEHLQGSLDLACANTDNILYTTSTTADITKDKQFTYEGGVGPFAASKEVEDRLSSQLALQGILSVDLGKILCDYFQRDEMFQQMKQQLDQTIAEKDINDKKLKSAYTDLEQMYEKIKVANQETSKWQHRSKSLEVDLDTMSQRAEKLFDELRQRTNQYNQIIQDLDDFAQKQSCEAEKKLIEQLAQCQQELYESQQIHKTELEAYNIRISFLQDEVNRLQEQLKCEITVSQKLRSNISSLEKDLAHATKMIAGKFQHITTVKEETRSLVKQSNEEIPSSDAKLQNTNQKILEPLKTMEVSFETTDIECGDGKHNSNFRAGLSIEMPCAEKRLDIPKKGQPTAIISSLPAKHLRTRPVKTSKQQGKKTSFSE